MMVLIGIIILILAITLIIMGSMIGGDIYHLYFTIKFFPLGIFLSATYFTVFNVTNEEELFIS